MFSFVKPEVFFSLFVGMVKALPHYCLTLSDVWVFRCKRPCSQQTEFTMEAESIHDSLSFLLLLPFWVLDKEGKKILLEIHPSACFKDADLQLQSL